jgi:hypothetical protein
MILSLCDLFLTSERVDETAEITNFRGYLQTEPSYAQYF